MPAGAGGCWWVLGCLRGSCLSPRELAGGRTRVCPGSRLGSGSPGTGVVLGTSSRVVQIQPTPLKSAGDGKTVLSAAKQPSETRSGIN